MPILEDGQIFERYRIIKWLGSGSSGESYEAEDKMLLRKVTLKLIHPWTTLPDSARRQFFREMQGISALNHPYLAPVLDYGEIEGRIYIARRYVSNGSLLGPNGRSWFRPPLAVTNAFIYIHQLAKVLHYIHQHGYLHGSLTFANVLVLRGPNVENEADYAPFLLADVGLASFVRRFGKPSIQTLPVSAAPEQLRKRVMPASDQFALAVLLYFWLTGHPPYLGTPSEVEHLKLSETITPLTALNPSVTNVQNSLILRALAAQPQKRHASVLAFAEALVASLSSPPQPQATATNSLPNLPETPQDFLSPSPSPEEVPLANAEKEVPDPSTPIPASFSEEQPAPVMNAFATVGSSQTPTELLLTQMARPEETPPVVNPEAQPLTAPLLDNPPAPIPEEIAREHTSELPVENFQEKLTSTAPLPDIPETPMPEEIATEHTSELPVQNFQEDLLQTDPDLLSPRMIISPPYSNNSYEFVLTDDETTIGRAGASDLLLDQDNLTSRHHALIKREDQRVLIFDKRSNNGVFVNGQQINAEQGYELADGDHISIGSYEIIFRSSMALRNS